MRAYTALAALAAAAGVLAVSVAAGDSNPNLRAADDTTSSWASHMAGNELAGMALAALAVFVAGGGGTGGGGVLDPIYILIMGLDPKTAIPLSSITIVGGAISNFLINVQRTQKDSSDPLIDWDFMLMMQPMLLLGAGAGTILNQILPTWLLCGLLVVVLSVTGLRTLQKAIEERKKERWLCCTSPQEESTTLLNGSAAAVTIQTNLNDSIKPKALRQKADIPWAKVGALFGVFFGILLLNLLQGGKRLPSPLGINSSSSWSPIVSALPFGFLGAISYLSMKNIVKTFATQQQPGYEPTPHEIKWTPHSLWYFPLLSVAAGAVSGMFGIGGGIINGPLLLEMGMSPAAASAMTATTVLFSSGMSSFQYMLAGSVDATFVEIMFPMGFVMTYLGHTFLLKLVRRFNCPSMIVFSMAIIVLISAVAMSIESIRAVFAA